MTDEANDLLTAVRDGDKGKLPQLVELVYDDLRKLAARYMDGEKTGTRCSRRHWCTRRS